MLWAAFCTTPVSLTWLGLVFHQGASQRLDMRWQSKVIIT